MSETNWIPVEIGMPNDLVTVDIKTVGLTEPLVGWYIHGRDVWIKRCKNGGEPITGVEFWRPRPAARTHQVGQTEAGDPITLAACCSLPHTPSYYVLDFAVDGLKTKWVDMATVQRLRGALASAIIVFRQTGNSMPMASRVAIDEAEAAMASSPAE